MKAKNLPLILGLAIPALTICLILAFTLLPALFVKPTVNFAYALNQNSYYDQFAVVDGMIKQQSDPSRPIDIYSLPTPEPRLYIHNVQTNVSQPISFEELQKKHLKNTALSSDGFTLQQRGYSGGGFLFGSSPSSGQTFLRKGLYSKTMNIERSDGYGNSFQMLGWVE